MLIKDYSQLELLNTKSLKTKMLVHITAGGLEEKINAFLETLNIRSVISITSNVSLSNHGPHYMCMITYLAEKGEKNEKEA